MELVIDETREAEGVKAEGQRKKREGAQVIAKGVATLLFAFFVSRVSFFYFMYPCGVALLTVLMSKGKWNIYALPMVLLGICTGRGIMTYLWGDILAASACALLFFFWRSCPLSMIQRGIVAGAITGGAKLVWGLQNHIFYIYDGMMILGECLLVFVFIYLFEGATSMKRSTAENVAALGAMVILLAKGVFPVYIGDLSPTYIAAIFFTLCVAYYLGALEGAAAGILAGLLLMGISGSVPSVGHILACGGLAAGALRHEKRWIAALCYIGVLLSFGALRGYPNLYMNLYEPILAGAAFAILPRQVMSCMGRFWNSLGNSDMEEEAVKKATIKSKLQGYQDTFSYLARAYGRRNGTEPVWNDESSLRGVRLAVNNRAVLACQFKGMAKAIDGMVLELEQPGRTVELRPLRYNVQLGVSGYAKEGGISGDSYLCTELKKGEYMMVLSDGMGKGKKAAEESILTVNTLYQLLRAGFDAELALNIINSVLLVKSTEEIFSTVDLSLLNLYTGRMKLYKIGAAASFIKRGEEVLVVKVATLPVGIVDQIPIECLDVSVRKGDQIITVSDGITEANPGDEYLVWLKEAIASMTSQDPQTIADRIINLAVQQWGIRERDDMTVLVVRVD